MKTKFFSIIASLLLTTIMSCRQESDKLMTYDHPDPMVFGQADTSFAAKFKVFWNAMNQYYAIWDYEAEFGLDWDAVYREYLPKFEALDRQDMVTDDELKELMDQAFSPIHDGHFSVLFSNHKTGTEEVRCQPGRYRAMLRDDYDIAWNYPPSLDYYSQVANGEIEIDPDGNPWVLESSTLDNPKFGDYGVGVKFALFKGNIAYFQFTDFHLTPYINYLFSTSDPTLLQQMLDVRNVWAYWFAFVQELHEDGTLGGVIIDVRGNHGGKISDFECVAGSLLPGGGYLVGYQRYKTGTGRYDYSPLNPYMAPTMDDSVHHAITEPVVVLTNCMSVSMSETTALAAKAMPNGIVIGKRSFGANCMNNSNNATFTSKYVSFIGQRHQTPVYAIVPQVALYTVDHKLIEGVGIEPDIEVDFDVNLFETTGRDSQLDRALQYLRTGN